MSKLFDFIKTESDEMIWALCEDLHVMILETYFGKYWKAPTTSFEHSGERLIEKINQLNPQSVLDIGCGHNPYKGRIQNLLGVDPFNDKADIKMTIHDYYTANKDKQFDVVMALGSINYGSKEKILYEVDLVDKMTKPGGYQFWRVNPGHNHNNKEFPLADLIDFFPWDKEFVYKIAEIYGYEVKEFEVDHKKDYDPNVKSEERLYFCFYKY